VTARTAVVRFYVDADILGLGKLIASLRNDVTYPGDPGAEIHKRQRPPCPITSPDVLDPDWIPEVARRGWLIVTRDSAIITNRNEIAAVREHRAKMVALNQQDAGQCRCLSSANYRFAGWGLWVHDAGYAPVDRVI
jgi:PIN domain-containing protein